MSELDLINERIKKEMPANNGVNGTVTPVALPNVVAPTPAPAATTTAQTAPAPTTTTTAPTSTEPDYSKITDEALMKLISERNIAPAATTVKTPEQIQQEKEARELSVIKYGIEKLGKTKDALLKPSELKNKKDEDLVREQYFADAKKRNPKILDETIEARYKKEFKIPTEADEYDEDEIAYGKQKESDQAKFIRERASKDLNEVTEKWEKQASAEATYNTVSKEVNNYTKNNKTFSFEIGGHKIDYTLSDEQINNLNKGLTDTIYVAKTNYAGQDIDLAKQAAFVAREQNLDSIISTLVSREADSREAAVLAKFGNPTPFASTSTGTGETIDQKVLNSLNSLPGMPNHNKPKR